MPDELDETMGELLDKYDRLIGQLPYDDYVRYIAGVLERLTDDWSPSLDEAFLELAQSTLAMFGDGSVPDEATARAAYPAWEEMYEAIASSRAGDPASGLSELFINYLQEISGSLRQRDAGLILPPLLDKQAWQDLSDGLEQYNGSVRADVQVKETQMLVREISYLQNWPTNNQ